MSDLGNRGVARHEKLVAYCHLVRSWASRVNLISAGDLRDLERRHISDSLRLLPLIRELAPGAGIDVGSGAGLPGIPLAISEPKRVWRLLEPRTKRAAFLEEVVRELELVNCEVVRKSAQDAARDPILSGTHVVATARALAPPAEAFDLLRPLVRPEGHCLLFVGEKAELPAEADSPSPGVARLVIPPAREGSDA